MARVDPGSSKWCIAAAAVALAACASAGPPAPPAAPPFQGIRSVVLVREVEGSGRQERRPRDPLDALGDSLRDRGLATRVVEVGPGLRDELRDVERVVRDVEWRIRSSPPRAGPDGRRPEALGRAPGEALRGVGADAFAIYLRLEGRIGPRTSPPPGSPWLEPGGPGAYPPRRTAALALVDRAGALLWFDWGGDEAAAPEDSSRVVNAAEAVDEAVRVLAGEPSPDGS